MISFKRQYFLLAALLFAGLGLALSTLFGVDSRLGWIAAGFTIGVQVAIHMMRTAELRFARVLREREQDAGVAQDTTPALRAAAPSDAPAPPPAPVQEAVPQVNGEQPSRKPRIFVPGAEPAVEPGKVFGFHPAAAFPQDASTGEAEKASEPAPTEEAGPPQPAEADSTLCACACGCELSSDGGFEGLCKDCRSQRLQEVLNCECDYMYTSVCTCGTIKHEPAKVESSVASAGA